MRDSRGSVLIEFAVVAPVMMLLIFGGIELGMVMVSRQQLEFATEAAAKCFATKNANCLTTAATKTYAAGISGYSPDIFSVSTMPCGGSVIANYNYAPMILPKAIPIGASACYPT
jgi:Flp pilus assembly protein TadG